MANPAVTPTNTPDTNKTIAKAAFKVILFWVDKLNRQHILAEKEKLMSQPNTIDKEAHHRYANEQAHNIPSVNGRFRLGRLRSPECEGGTRNCK